MSSSARFDELKKKFDENPRRYFAPLANEFRKSGDAEQAVMICEEFLPQQPGHMSGHIVYGQALFDLGRLDDARTVFETALTLDPENLIALRHLGDIARSHGDLESARQWYQRVLEADPRNEEVQSLIAAVSPQEAAATPAAPAREEQAPPPGSFLEPATTTIIEQSTTVELATPFEPAATVPPPLPPTPPPEAESLLDLDVLDEPAIETGASSRADGFEAMEFTPPPANAASELADHLETSDFTAPTSSVAPLEGLEETALGAFDARAEVAPPPPPLPDLEPLPEMQPASAAGPVSELALAATTGLAPESTAADEPPVDIPPEVIAAEAELIDAREEVAAQPPAPPRVTPSQPFVTETMAELYMKQGFHDQALDVYKLLLAASPDNQHLRERVAELQQRGEKDSGPNVREFLARLAARRPGDAGAATVPPASDDFASFDSFETLPASAPVDGPAPESAAATTPTTPHAHSSVAPELAGLPMLDEGPIDETGPAPSPSASSAQAAGGEGSIDALFAQGPVDQADASAASALAQAFGAEHADTPAITGRPARAAAGELSLDSVFRDGGGRPPRNAQSFSFDQFFSESAAAERPAVTEPPPTPSQGVGAQPEPAERDADDIEQFNSWLQGLKQK